MPSAQAKPLHASSLQQELLQKMAHRTTSAQRLVKRVLHSMVVVRFSEIRVDSDRMSQ